MGGGDAARVRRYDEPTFYGTQDAHLLLDVHTRRRKRRGNGREKYPTWPGMNIVCVQNCGYYWNNYFVIL